MSLRSLSLISNPTTETIWEALMDPIVGKIGIYGLGGVGKTTAMRLLYNQLLTTEPYFDNIIWVTSSKGTSLMNIQKDIAQQLKLKICTYKDVFSRSTLLCERLKQANKFLLIFDDIRVPISLKTLGIPEPNYENHCKIVLTTRSLSVCQVMKTDRNIKVELLSEDESWNLFVRQAGSNVLNPDIEPFAREMISQCGSLPMNVIVVGRAMRQVNEKSEWIAALKNLKLLATEAVVHKCLRFSYDRLKNDTIRKCFLYCSFFPDDYIFESDELIKYWMAEDFIQQVDMVTEINEGSKILKELTDVGMLDMFGQRLRMQNMFRNFAINILRVDGEYLVKAGLLLQKIPYEQEWTNARKISLMRNHIEAILNPLNCRNLSTLSLKDNPLSYDISYPFFEPMLSLKFLDLSCSGISELPLSISNLSNLRALFLQSCKKCKYIPPIGNLKELRILNLSETSIKQLPHGMTTGKPNFP
ncbi:hypothetical protein AQUCO_06300038v1 [Aquilegia coerulea]|uniref:Uncharacterized protein n=1 Tax=Aquilegia coerulea TaxID=218851 RepID=A0A2G5CCU1_AQUCA|nr:hypothetical protein AQUCO_06300038v1 [Aquilegia coerulea]